jgi:ribosomal protein L37E
MDCSYCGFGRVRSRPVKIIKGTKKAANYLKIRHFP